MGTLERVMAGLGMPPREELVREGMRLQSGRSSYVLELEAANTIIHSHLAAAVAQNSIMGVKAVANTARSVADDPYAGPAAEEVFRAYAIGEVLRQQRFSMRAL